MNGGGGGVVTALVASSVVNVIPTILDATMSVTRNVFQNKNSPVYSLIGTNCPLEAD
jgi:hypothetical protein